MLKDCNSSYLVTKSYIADKHSFTAILRGRANARTPIVTAPCPPIKHFDQLPFPDSSLIDLKQYMKHPGFLQVSHSISLQATRGCPFNCAYCFKIWPKIHIFRSAENIFAEVQLYYKMGIRRFYFVDDIFNFNKKNSQRFFELIIEYRLDVQFFFLLRGDILTPDYIDLMVKAGLKLVRISLETATPRLQKMIRKNLNIKRLQENIEYITTYHPHIILELNTMHGFPTETEEEAMETLNFINNIKWVDFPYIHILKIYPNTDMEKLALQHGVSKEAIERTESSGFHEVDDTLPFDKGFTLKYQTQLLNEYFLSKERLRHVLPKQMVVLTEREIVLKYNSYLGMQFEDIDELLQFLGLSREELRLKECLDEEKVRVPHLNEKVKHAFPEKKPLANALRILLVDLSRDFTQQSRRLGHFLETPLGLMYLLGYLHQQFGAKVKGKIIKPGIDFDNFNDLKEIVDEFKPEVVGIRSLTFFRDNFHKTAALVRLWGFNGPLITGGPYATCDYVSLLQDRNVDLAVLGEGEIIFAEIIEKILENNGELPGEEILAEIKGIAFMPGIGKMKREQRPGLDIFLLDEISDLLSLTSGTNLKPINKPTDLVYGIFTSGSTGNPKGVLLQHQNLNNLICGLNERIYNQYKFKGTLNIGFLSPLIFDASIKQIFAALLLGHCLNIVPEAIRVDGRRLIDFYEKHQLDISDGTPLHLRLLLECLKEGVPVPGVTNFIIGGEALPRKLAGEFLHFFEPHLTCITNVYGPTECCVDSTTFEISGINVSHLETIPLGHPLPNQKIIILNKENRLQPVGIPGELCISGDNVARGYLNDVELTRKKFMDNPFVPGERLYKTGDLAQWLPDGTIEFLGRLDHQVKIRGNRIEPEGIETQLLKHEAIQEAVVIAREGEGTGESHLCAYIVADKEISVSQLIKHLTRDLPGYMVPSYFVQLEGIPRTPGGKLDVKALQAYQGMAHTGDKYAEPRTPAEKQMVNIWQQVLKIEKIGIYDNFFEIGGDSLKAIQLISEMIKHFDVSMNDIFKYQTVAALMENIVMKKDNLKKKIEELRTRLTLPVNKVTADLDPVQQKIMEELRTYRQQVNQTRIKGLKVKNRYRKILLTGATGFLGAHLAAELLKTTNAEIYLLVRGKSVEDSTRRLERRLSYYFGPDFYHLNEERLHVVQGDLCSPGVGMDDSRFKSLSETIDVVLHSAANVKHFGHYQDFYQTNVLGTEKLLQFSMTGKQKDFHYISSLSVCSGDVEGKEYMVYTDLTGDVGQQHENVYIKSKFEAEKKVFSSREKGLKASIYRMGNLVFHSDTGIFQENIEDNAFYANVKAFITLGAVADNLRLSDFTFVDQAAHAIVLLMMREPLLNRNYHIQNHHAFAWKDMERALEKAGIKIQFLRPNLFLDYLVEQLENHSHRANIERLLLHSGLLEKERKKRTINMTASDQSLKLLEKLHFQWPEITDDHIFKMIVHCQKVGFLDQ
ncbi:MAG: AMP-binding protein [Candidatus Aminicenantes bacterium]|nr:AMP-binding protein [Candidatus Aminicenantes bacterium]NIM79490.1 AMP-binding protein [Candidatus Aminicenantes bacterium]NIN18776.1 AMP-binding protein [Candidatus Aminicenantes bacterium]NIN42698.1 AMP-binding protein [Candidatus Aminicenantes bacterium]NIN85432.1 AMP-binding protein [Candidatus Aminicenantes bacterium]